MARGIAKLYNEEIHIIARKNFASIKKVVTIAVGALLAVYNWPKGSNRYERTALLVRDIFDSLPVLQTDAYHPKWKEVDVKAPLPRWERFVPAEEWLKANEWQLFWRRFFISIEKSLPHGGRRVARSLASL